LAAEKLRFGCEFSAEVLALKIDFKLTELSVEVSPQFLTAVDCKLRLI
jgi:hypothetical protein